MKLWDIAHSRTGDKGDISNVSLIAYDPKDYAMLCEKVLLRGADGRETEEYRKICHWEA